MKNAVLNELISRWEYEAIGNQVEDGSDSDDAKISRARNAAYRECKRECADALRTLIQILPGE